MIHILSDDMMELLLNSLEVIHVKLNPKTYYGRMRLQSLKEYVIYN